MAVCSMGGGDRDGMDSGGTSIQTASSGTGKVAGLGLLGIVSDNARLNEVALPSAAATDASSVVICRPVVCSIRSHPTATQHFSRFPQPHHNQADTIQIPYPLV